MLLLRKIFFYSFLVIYLILCPLIIFYALGITFRPKTQTLLKTGLIHITTIPDGAKIYINRRIWKEKTPSSIRNLIPGEYWLQLSKRDYQTWSRLLPVVEEKATTLENIILIPKVWPSKALLSRTFENLIPLEGEPFLLLKNGASLKDHFIFSLSQGSNSPFRQNNPSASGSLKLLKPIDIVDTLSEKMKIKRFFSVKKSPFLLLEIEDGWNVYRYFWVNLRSDASPSKEVTSLFPKPPQEVIWGHDQDHILFSRDGETITQIDTQMMSAYAKIIQKVHGFTVFNDQLYVLTSDHILKRFNYTDQAPEILLDDKQLSRELFGKDQDWQIHILAPSLMIFTNKDGALISDQLPYLLMEKGVKGFSFDKQNERLLIWTNNQIAIIDFVKSSEETSFEKGPRVTFLMGKGKRIEQAFWIEKTPYVLFRDNNRVYLLEAFTDLPDPQIQQIPGLITRSFISYSSRDGLLFFLDAETKKLSFIEILPSEDVRDMLLEEKKVKEKNAL